MTDGLVAFLRDCLDEDQAGALAAPGRTWTAHREDDIAGASVYDEQWVLLYPQEYDHDKALSGAPGATGPAYIQERRDELCAHIARHDPARVLAEVEAKRAIVAACSGDEPGTTYYLDNPDVVDGLNWRVLQLLALPYADRPGYQPEWRT